MRDFMIFVIMVVIIWFVGYTIVTNKEKEKERQKQEYIDMRMEQWERDNEKWEFHFKER